MDPESNEALLQPREEEERQHFELQNERQGLNQMKSFEILKSALQYLTSDTKFLFFLILSSIPFFAFIVLYEIKFPEVYTAISNFLALPYFSWYDYDINVFIHDGDDENYATRTDFGIVPVLLPFYLFLLPLLEIFSLPVIINIAAKIYRGNTERTTLKETFYQKKNLKSPFVTCLLVQLFSTSTLFGLFWAVSNHHIITRSSYPYYHYGWTYGFLSIGFHALIFLALLYKYLDWSVLWNMGIVISVLEEETGINALEMSAYYGKHSKQNGFKLMLSFFSYSVVVRLPFLLARMWNHGNLVVIIIVAVLVCLGGLVKWMAFVLYFYDCKAQVLLKKGDEEVGKAKAGNQLC